MLYLNKLGIPLNQLGQPSNLNGNTYFNQENKQESGTENNSASFSNSDEDEPCTNTYDTEETTEDESIDDPFKFFSPEYLTLMYSNIDQSLTGKMNELLGNIDKSKPDIIMLIEIEPKYKKRSNKAN